MTSPAAPKQMHVAIVGGGIGGAFLGIALSKFPNLTFTIYESRAAFGEIGTGLGFGANAHRAMNLISPDIWERYKTVASFNGWEEKQNVWFDFQVGEKGPNEGKRIAEIVMNADVCQSSAHRAHFLDQLVALLPKGCAQFGKRLVDVDQSHDRVVLKFSDGTEAEADVVVGCDGIRSACRTFVVEKELVAPRFTKKVAFRGLVPMKIAESTLGVEKSHNRQMYLGHNRHCITFSVAKGTLMNVVAFTGVESDTWEEEWVKPRQRETAQRAFQGWGENVTKIMQLIQDTDLWAIFDHPQVPTFHKDRLCLLGDAAHATSPHFGQGAGMAIEDAYVLSNLLSKCSTRTDITNAFTAYDAVRLPRALKVILASREQGMRLDMEGQTAGDDLKKLEDELRTVTKWIWDIDLEAHLGDALKRFDELKSTS